MLTPGFKDRCTLVLFVGITLHPRQKTDQYIPAVLGVRMVPDTKGNAAFSKLEVFMLLLLNIKSVLKPY